MEKKMKNIPRKLAVLVFGGVPAIIGGGIVYSLADHHWTPVWIYEAILLCVMGVLAWRAE